MEHQARIVQQQIQRITREQLVQQRLQQTITVTIKILYLYRPKHQLDQRLEIANIVLPLNLCLNQVINYFFLI